MPFIASTLNVYQSILIHGYLTKDGDIEKTYHGIYQWILKIFDIPWTDGHANLVKQACYCLLELSKIKPLSFIPGYRLQQYALVSLSSRYGMEGKPFRVTL